jgi:ATP-dependent DNA ligase
MTFIAPMLLETAAEPFDNDNYIFEPKIDGHRLILSYTNGTTAYTRVIIMIARINIRRSSPLPLRTILY